MPVAQRQYDYLFLNELIKPVPQSQYTTPDIPLRQDKYHQYPMDIDDEPTLDGLHVPEEVYWELYYEDTLYEWNNGILEVKPVSDYDGSLLERWINQLLNEYMSIEKNVQAITSEIGFRMSISSGIKIRKPDLALIGENSLKINGPDCTYKGTFDLCIEFLSDSNKSEILRDTVQKKKEYEQAGVKEYFILDRKGKHTHFYRLINGKFEPITSENDIIRSEVLKNFQFRIDHLYSRPELSELRNDPVYQKYVKVDVQEAEIKAESEKQRADIEKQRAESEKQRADVEKQRAESEKQRADIEKQRADNAEKKALLLAKKLAELGVTLEDDNH